MTNLLLSTMGIFDALKLSGFGFGIVLAVLAFLAIFVLILSSFCIPILLVSILIVATEFITSLLSNAKLALYSSTHFWASRNSPLVLSNTALNLVCVPIKAALSAVQSLTFL